MLKRSGDESRVGDVSEMLMQKPPLGTQLDFNNPLNKDLVMHLAMNEGHGDVVRDLSMNGNHGTLKNMAFPPTVASGWNPGRTGVGLNFDGTDDYVDCGNAESLFVNSGDFTISYLAKVPPQSGTSTYPAVTLYEDINNFMYLGFSDSAVRGFSKTDNVTMFNTSLTPIWNQWVNYAWVHTISDGALKLYLNGICVNEAPGTVFDGQPIIRVGARTIGGMFATGTIDQVRVHGRALTAKEVQDYYINPWQVYQQ